MIIGADIRVLGSKPHSGVQEYTQHILENMVRLDSAIQWRLFYAGRSPLQKAPWMSLSNVSLSESGMANRLLWARTRFTGRPYLDALIGGADVFFFPHFLLGATSPSCRRVMTWHDLSYERVPEFFSLGRRWWHRFQMQPRRQASTAHHILAVSRSTADDLEALYGIRADKITVVHSGIDAALTPVDQGSIQQYRARMHLPARFILALATQEPRKNLPGLIAAFERLAQQPRFTDVALILAGPSGWLMKPLLRAVAQSPVRTRIRLIGPVPANERALLLSSASVLAYPSLLEGFGFPPLEAMACGTPVLAAANSALFETIGDAGLLVDPYASDRVATALTAILDDRSLAEMLSRRGRLRAKSFSWERAAEQTLQALLRTAA